MRARARPQLLHATLTCARPAVEYTNHFPAAETRWDIVARDWAPAHWRYPPVPGRDRFVGSVRSAYVATDEFPLRWRTRGDPAGVTYYNYFAWAGGLTNATGKLVDKRRWASAD